jgi:hypothetical protein
MLNLFQRQEVTERTMTLHYQITVKEYLEDSWSTHFDGLAISHAVDGATTPAGMVRDQTALHGLIARVRDLGLTLVAVAQTPTDEFMQPTPLPGETTS